MTDVPVIDLCCEACGVPVLAVKLRVGPSIRRDGWRCSNPACAPRRDESAPQGTPVNNALATKESSCPGYMTD